MEEAEEEEHEEINRQEELTRVGKGNEGTEEERSRRRENLSKQNDRKY